ncbi:hypothetical protein HZC32_02100 [Candidatus Woesearchaeota archaeon]|nr:hypothetical protein [Candidatus Woesearchaeota archaeon]
MVQQRAKKVEVKEEGQGSFFSNFLRSLKEIVVSNAVSSIKENIKEKVKRIEKKIFRSIASFIFFVGGVIFIFLALIFFANYYFKLNFAWGFFLSGVIFILISLTFKWLAKRE